jgi:predicted S18 family serine protease
MRISSLSSRHVVAPLLILVALLAVPASASALSVTLDRPCYTNVPSKGSQPIVGTITGGTPGANFIFNATQPGQSTGSAGSVSGTFDAAGNAVATITGVLPPSGSIGPVRGQSVDLSVADYGTGATPADVPVGKALITNFAVAVGSTPSNPRKARSVAVSGGPFAGKTLYGFITKAGSTHVLRTFRVGKGNVCGYARTRHVVAPPSYRTGHYRLYVNAGRKLQPRLAVAYGFRIFTAR